MGSGLGTGERVSPRVWLFAGTLIALPVATFTYLRTHPGRDAMVGAGTPHFLIVSVTALITFGLAVAVMWAARRLPDPRTLFLAAGFLAMSGIFLAHGAGTASFFRRQHAAAMAPQATLEQAYADYAGYGDYASTPQPAQAMRMPASLPPARAVTVGFSARLSLLVSALCFALSVVELPGRISDWMLRRWTALVMGTSVILLGYIALALGVPARLEPVATAMQPQGRLVAAVTVAALSFAGWRFFQAYRLALLPLQGAMALGMVLLIEGQWFMVAGPVWHLSWWLYHLVMFIGFVIPVFGLLWQYRAAGDLGAIVEGLFLRDRLRGLHSADPRALTALAAAVAAKDSETGAHTERVGELAVAIGRRVGVPEERLELLRWAGRLHDLGKIGVPNRILRKPGRLTEAEFAVMRLHAPRGSQVAMRSRVLTEAAAIIRAHHERLNGSGYPDGLKGEQIPLEARVIAVADTWDAITCDRPYRAAMPFDQAAAIMRRESGEMLDARCVSALFDALTEAKREAA